MSKTPLKQSLLFIIVMLSLSSCATVFTSRSTNVNIKTTRPVNLVVEGDTILRETNETVYLRVQNSRAPIAITAFDSTGTKDIFVDWKTDPIYWANLLTGPVYFTGFLLDEITGKKRRYPRNVLIDPDGLGNSYFPYFLMDSALLVKRNKITFAPISIVHEYHPAFEFGYERLHGDKFATQVSLGIFRSWDNDFARNSSGFKASIEEKYFFRDESRTRYYFGLAFEHHNKKHDADISFLNLNNQGQVLFDSRFTQRTRVDKQFFALTPRVGFQSYLTPKLVAEGFFGIGLRHRRVRHLNANPNTVIDNQDDFLNFNFNTNDPGTRFSSNWDLNFRLAWVF